MSTTNLLKQEIVSAAPIATLELPKTNSYEEDRKRNQTRANHLREKQIRIINDNGTFIIEKTQDSLLANNNIYTKQLKMIKERGKERIIDNFHLLAEYEHPLAEYEYPLAERHTEMILTANDGESVGTPVVEKYSLVA
ncbi:MAG: hypothetical protein LBG52_04100 [Candidatus Peribacteria bacterium]|jgi:hypothetical protein|nr:hypothetical protein [Candidatus Peribacteria bacterium]